ncbi:MAG: GNAT family N-acetyltransferase [Dehalococcoidales bacterium]
MKPEQYAINTASKTDFEWIKELYTRTWSGDICVSRGKVQKVDDFTGGFVAETGGQNTMFITYTVTGPEVEITGIVSLKEKSGVGSALVKAVIEMAKKQKLKKVCLVTTNDNLNGIGFWQKRGFKLVKVYPGSMEYVRKIKPAVPLIGENGIPLRDELELEMIL